jgi:hypothetical protein
MLQAKRPRHRGVAMPPQPTQWANIVAYHLLLSLVNILNLPLKDGTFIPRRSMQLRVLDRDVERLRMLKRELDPTSPEDVRGFLVAPKAMFFELEVALHQWPDLARNPEFFGDMERLGTLIAQMRDLDDARGVRDLAFKLSVMLPFYEDEGAMGERNLTARRWYEKQV